MQYKKSTKINVEMCVPVVDYQCAPLEELPLRLAELHHGAVHKHPPGSQHHLSHHMYFQGSVHGIVVFFVVEINKL